MSSLAESPDLAAAALRARIEAAYERSYGRTIRVDTLDKLEDVVRWLAHKLEGGERTVLTTWAEAAVGIGWPAEATATKTRIRHGSNVRRRLDMLKAMGWIESWRPMYDGRGTGEGILIVLGRDSSVGRAHD